MDFLDARTLVVGWSHVLSTVARDSHRDLYASGNHVQIRLVIGFPSKVDGGDSDGRKRFKGLPGMGDADKSVVSA
jgi:hypothetical protein